jgi:hypothetical protein
MLVVGRGGVWGRRWLLLACVPPPSRRALARGCGCGGGIVSGGLSRRQYGRGPSRGSSLGCSTTSAAHHSWNCPAADRFPRPHGEQLPDVRHGWNARLGGYPWDSRTSWPMTRAGHGTREQRPLKKWKRGEWTILNFYRTLGLFA